MISTMLPIRKLIKRTNRHYSLRKKINGKKTSNDKRIYMGPEDAKQQNDHLNIITLFPNKA